MPHNAAVTGTVIKAVRTSRGLNQIQAAREIGISVAAIRLYETGGNIGFRAEVLITRWIEKGAKAGAK